MSAEVINTLIALGGVLASGVSAYFGVRLAIRELQVMQRVLEKGVDDHEKRIRELERGERQPLDYVPR